MGEGGGARKVITGTQNMAIAGVDRAEGVELKKGLGLYYEKDKHVRG